MPLSVRLARRFEVSPDRGANPPLFELPAGRLTGKVCSAGGRGAGEGRGGAGRRGAAGRARLSASQPGEPVGFACCRSAAARSRPLSRSLGRSREPPPRVSSVRLVGPAHALLMPLPDRAAHSNRGSAARSRLASANLSACINAGDSAYPLAALCDALPPILTSGEIRVAFGASTVETH